jgi:hypothetical protein
MAHRLARAFGTSPEMWLGLQQDVDLWDTHQARRAEYERIKRVAPSRRPNTYLNGLWGLFGDSALLLGLAQKVEIPPTAVSGWFKSNLQIGTLACS